MAAVTDADPTRPAAPPAAPDADPGAARRHWHANLRLTAFLLAAWFGVSFVIPWFARDLGFAFFGWPFGFWVAAQGGTCVFVLLIVAYAVGMRRLDRTLASRSAVAVTPEPPQAPRAPQAPQAPQAPAAAGAGPDRHAR
jgi:putative solute:sodium symporter small subunit